MQSKYLKNDFDTIFHYIIFSFKVVYLLVDIFVKILQMFQIMSSAELKQDLEEKLTLGRDLLDKLANNQFKKVQGIQKLEKKIRQEIKFLEKFEDPDQFSELKKEHISCSNLVHLSSIVEKLFLVKNVIAVLQPFNLKSDGNKTKKVLVDIVCDKGQSWIKVVARNPKSLFLNSQGGSQFGQRNIKDQVS